jgi:hypothetical protein
MMAMLEPIAGFLMNLNAPHPQGISYLNLGMMEIRTGISVQYSGIQHLYYLTLCGLQRVQWE